MEIPNAFFRELSTMMGGLKRKVERERQDIGLKMTEGKLALTFVQYQNLCNVFMGMDSAESNFGHCFLTLEWDLMSRADTVTMVHMNHIEWRDDSLVLFFGHTKGDQEGNNHKEGWHVFANPLCP